MRDLRRVLLAGTLTLCLTTAAQAEPTVVGGVHNLLVNTDGQLVQISVTGIAPETVNGMTFYFATGDGGPEFGGFEAPRISSIDVDSGPTIWNPPNSAGHDPPFIYIDDNGQFAAVEFLTTEGYVNVSSGLVLTLTIDTTGVSEGLYLLELTGGWVADNVGISDFTGQNFTSSIINGSIFLHPEPSSIVTGLIAVTAFALIAVRKRCRAGR